MGTPERNHDGRFEPLPEDAMGIWVLLTTVALLGLIAAERRSHARGRAVTKMLASTGFVAAAVASGALDSVYGSWVLVALALSWIGDACLLSSARAWFLGGLVAFLLGHVGYTVAFAVRGFDPVTLAVAFGVMLIPAAVVGVWLLPRVDRGMRGPVLAYMAVISVMVAFAAATVGRWGNGWILAAAVMFYLSDLAVARDRFVAPGFSNRLWGLPLYYGAQIVFAWTVASEIVVRDGLWQMF